MPRYTNSGQLAEIMKSEIVRDMHTGSVPANVSSFSELHDFLDANTYGSPEVDDPYIDIPVIDEAQCIVDSWLQSRRGRVSKTPVH